MSEKFYWLKLKKDFFKRHDIRIIESMPNGKDYILFYLKLLCESIDHEGGLRFSDTIPYNDEMLSTITNTNVDIVRSAIKVFTELNMMSVLDDGTLYMTEVNKMIGSAVDNDNANRQRRFREKKKQEALCERYDSVTKNNESKSIDIDKDIDIYNKEINKEKKTFVVPTLEEIKKYIKEKDYNVDAETFYNFYESKGWYVGKNKMKDWKKSVVVWHRKTLVDNNKFKAVVPSFYDDYKQGNFEQKPMTEEEKKEMEDIVKDLFQ